MYPIINVKSPIEKTLYVYANSINKGFRKLIKDSWDRWGHVNRAIHDGAEKEKSVNFTLCKPWKN